MTKEELFVFFAVVYFLLSIPGCASDQRMHDLLQQQNPDCYVDADLSMVCPPPSKNFWRYDSEEEKE